MRRRQPGFTLAEIIVYAMLSVMVLGVIYSVFVTGRRHYEAASSSYLVSREVETALRWLRSDLQEASLASIRVYPNEEHPDASPGISLASPRDLDQKLQINALGAPEWSSYVYYTVDEEGTVVRWMEEHDFQGLPRASTKLPSDTSSRKNERVMLHGVSRPLSELEGLEKLGPRGGFDLQFVRPLDNGEELLSSWNPGQVSNGEAKPAGRNSKLLQLLITVEMNNFRKSKKSYVMLPIRVMPRH